MVRPSDRFPEGPRDDAPRPSDPDRDLIEAGRREARRGGSREPTPGVRTEGSAPELPAGAIPGYRIRREIHRGGQGVVYLAVQESTRREVAIKVLAGGAWSAPHERARFTREVEILGSLRHPNIVSVHDGGTSGGFPWFAMDYVPGQPLDVYMASGTRTVRETLELFAVIAEAVEAAHVRGILHRDLKPSNVRIDPDGRPHVLDFGLAKPLPRAGDAGTMTVTGQFVGSLPWASPEQTGDDPGSIDLRSDVYSLGVVLYQMLTGRFPYEVVGNLLDVIANVRRASPVPPRRLRPELDDDVETILLKCLAKERERRYQTAGELARDVRAWLEGRPIQAKRDSAGYVLRKLLARYRVAVGFAVAGVVALGLGLVVALRLLATASAERKRAEEANVATLAAKGQVEVERERLERSLYFNRVLLARYALREDNGERAQELLAECPEELRGFEWDHLRWCSDRSLLALGHEGATVDIARFSPDGVWVATGAADGAVRVFHATSGYRRHRLEGHEGTVAALAWAPDGSRLYTAGEDGTLRAWEPSEGVALGTLAAGPAAFRALSVGMDGATLAVGDAVGRVRVLRSSDGEVLLEHEPAAGTIGALAFAVDGRHLFVGLDDGRIELRLSSGEVERVFMGHGSRVTSLASSPDGSLLASGSIDGTARLWHAWTGEEVRSLRAHGNWVYGVAFDPYGRTLLTSGADHSPKLWDVATGRHEKTLRGHAGRVFAVAFDVDGRRAVSASGDGTARVWDVAAAETSRRYAGHASQVWCVAFRPDGERIASGSSDGTVRIWDADDERVLPTVLRGHRESVIQLAWTPDGLRLATAGEDGTARIWDPASGVELRKLEGHGGWVYAIAFYPEGRRLLTGGGDGTLRVWDVERGVQLAASEPSERPVFGASLSPDGRWVATTSRAGSIRIHDAETLAAAAEVRGHERTTFSSAWSPDSSLLATAGFDGSIVLWSVGADGEPRSLRTLRGHRNGVRCVAYSPDGARIASGGWDATVRLWDVRTGAETAELVDHADRVDGVAFSPDGTRIASSSLDGDVRVWESDWRHRTAR